jgi:protein TonB
VIALAILVLAQVTPPQLPPAFAVPYAPPAPSTAPIGGGLVVPTRARANLASYISDADYPSAGHAQHMQGTIGFRLAVGTDGRVTNCDILSSSGFPLLDETTCALLTARARFTPARDARGNPTTDVVSARISWVEPVD